MVALTSSPNLLGDVKRMATALAHLPSFRVKTTDIARSMVSIQGYLGGRVHVAMSRSPCVPTMRVNTLHRRRGQTARRLEPRLAVSRCASVPRLVVTGNAGLGCVTNRVTRVSKRLHRYGSRVRDAGLSSATMRGIQLQSTLVILFAGVALWGCSSTPEPQVTQRDFVAMTMTGEEFSGESLQGKVTILDFWAVY